MIPLDGFSLQDIKSDSITVNQLNEMKGLAESYESLFSRRAKKYKAINLKNEILNEDDYKQLISEEYTFLKRPVVIVEDNIFVGNSKKTINSLLQIFEY